MQNREQKVNGEGRGDRGFVSPPAAGRALVLIWGLLLACATTCGQELVAAGEPAVPLTLVLESRSAVSRGVGFLLARQQADGSWSRSTITTGLAAVALRHVSLRRPAESPRDAVARACAFLQTQAREDGAICAPGRADAVLSTAVALTALTYAGDPGNAALMRRARGFLMAAQLDEDHPQQPADAHSPAYGGFAKGHADGERQGLAAVSRILEALYVSDFVSRPPMAAPAAAEATDRLWQKAVVFLTRTQVGAPDGRGLPRSESGHVGGFVDDPRDADQRPGVTDCVATCAGLNGLLFAELQSDDPRVVAAVAWAERQGALRRSPARPGHGRLCCLLNLSQALDAAGMESLGDQEARRRPWRSDVLRELLGLQKGDGGWAAGHPDLACEQTREQATACALRTILTCLGRSAGPR